MQVPRVLFNQKLSPLILLAGLFCWFIFILTARVAPGDLGLAQSMGPFYFVGVTLILMSILLGVLNKRVDLFTYTGLAALFLSLTTTPYLIDGTPYFYYTFRVVGYTNYILETGTYDPVGLPYMNWPGVMISGAFVNLLSGLSLPNLLYLFPFVIKPLEIALVGLIVLAFSQQKHLAVLGAVVFMMFDWTAYYYFLPPSLGVLLFLACVYLFVARDRAGFSGWGWTFLLMTLVLGMIISHLLSSVLFLAIMGLLFIFEKKPFFKGFWKRTTTIRDIHLLTIFSIVGFYVLLANTNMVLSVLPTMTRSLGNFFYVFSGAQNVSQNSSTTYSDIILIKVIFTAIIGVVLLLAIIYVLRTRKLGDRSMYLPLAGIICAAIVPVTIFSSYSFEAINRAFEYVLPFLVLFLIYSWRSKIVVVAVVACLLVSPFLFVISAYGNAQVDSVTREEVRGVEYYYDTAPAQSVVYNYQEGPILMEKIYQYRWRTVAYVDGNPNWASNPGSTFMLYSDRDLEREGYFNPQLDKAAYLNDLYFHGTSKIYSTGSFEMFKRV